MNAFEHYIQTFLNSLIHKQSPLRWQLLGGNGGTLDVDEQHVGSIAGTTTITQVTGGAAITQTIFEAIAKTVGNPEVITVSVGLKGDIVAAQTGAPTIFPQAIITWGAGGALNTATVDVIRGTQISVAATYLRVDAVYNPPGAVGVPIPLTFVANAAYGSRDAASTEPGFTTTVTGVLNGASRIIPIPSYAINVTVFSAETAGAVPSDLLITFCPRDDGLAAVNIGSIWQYEQTNKAAVPLTYPLPGSARSLVIRNDSAASTSITVRFGLAL